MISVLYHVPHYYDANVEIKCIVPACYISKAIIRVVAGSEAYPFHQCVHSCNIGNELKPVPPKHLNLHFDVDSSDVKIEAKSRLICYFTN